MCTVASKGAKLSFLFERAYAANMMMIMINAGVDESFIIGHCALGEDKDHKYNNGTDIIL